MLRMFLFVTAALVVVHHGPGSVLAIDPEICANLVCPRTVYCPEGTLETWSTFKTPVESLALDKDSNQIPLSSTDDSTPEDAKDKVKRSFPDADLADSPEVEPSNSTYTNECCQQRNCVCDTTICRPLVCTEDEVAFIENSDNVGQPGNCCPDFLCRPKVECRDKPPMFPWRENCQDCFCYNGTASCTQRKCYATGMEAVSTSAAPPTCLSSSTYRHYKNGTAWTEDGGCTQCRCLNGQPKCHSSVCKPLACDQTVRPVGECCDRCEGFCAGEEFCNRHCPHGFTFDRESNCKQCRCEPRPDTTPPVVLLARDEPTTPASISGIAPPTSPSTSNASLSTSEPKASVQINIINNNYHNSTVAEQEDTGNQNMIILGCVTFVVGLILGGLAGMLYMRSRQKKKMSYSTVPSYDTNANAIPYKAA